MTQYPGLKVATDQEIVAMQRLLRRLGYLQAEHLSRKLDEATATAVTLDLGRQDNVRTTLCRAFDEAEFKAIVSKL